MSTEKLSELSKPVATVDVQRGRPDRNMFGVAWSSAGHAMPDGPHFLYSQEYVSALKHESAVNWEAAASLNVENQELKQRIDELSRLLTHNIERAEAAEKRLATPVRLPDDLEPNTEPCVICGVVSSHPEGWHYCHPKCGKGDA